MPSLTAPFINGMRYDFSSIKFMIGGTRYYEVQDISYKDTLAPGSVRGAGAVRRGRTRGVYDAEGSLTLYKQEWENLATDLVALSVGQLGFGEQDFKILCIYSEGISNPAIITDILEGVRIKSPDNSHKEGGDALVVKLDLDIMRIFHNGKTLVSAFPF